MKTIASRVWGVATVAAIGMTGSGCEEPVGAEAPVEVFAPSDVLVAESEQVQSGYVNEAVLEDPTVRLVNDAGATMTDIVGTGLRIRWPDPEAAEPRGQPWARGVVAGPRTRSC